MATTRAFLFLRPNYDTLVCDFGQAGDDPALSKEELSPALAGLSLAPRVPSISREQLADHSSVC
jgi:hypothetical protein